MGSQDIPENVFIVGSPRSGTSLLGRILNLHPQIDSWYEPYYVIDHYFRNAPDDCRTVADANPLVQEYIRQAFEYYRRKRECLIVVDKSPRNSLKIPFLCAIFPAAKFIHILRDGRDATLSIHQRWQQRGERARARNLGRALHTVRDWLARQPLLAHKVAALLFEIGSPADILQGRSPLHRSRWFGRRGWGPQFQGWELVIQQVACLEFNALQWIKCVEAVLTASGQMGRDRFLEIRYETLLRQPQATLETILTFLKVSFPPDLMSRVPELRLSNSGRWRQAWSSEEKALVGPILSPMLVRLGYAQDDSWYTR